MSWLLSYTSTWVQQTYDVMDEEHQLEMSLFAADRPLNAMLRVDLRRRCE